MPNNGKRFLCSKSKSSSFSKRSIANYLLKNMSSCKESNGKRSELQRKSQVKKIVSILSKRRASNAAGSQNVTPKIFKRRANVSGRRNRNNSSNVKRKKRTLQKVYNTNAVKKQSYSKPVFGRTSLSQRENENQARSEGNIRRKRKKRKRKKVKENGEQDEASRLQRRTRYLLIKMKMEQTLIDAYSGEGWKGQSREKIKPEKELQRAENQILKCKLGIRDAIHQLDLLSTEGCIEDSVIDPDGSVFHEHIFCAKCKLRDAFPDNDIILCDGACNCAFHQKCLDPPLATENIPPGDQGWLCKFCECKTEILDAVNAHLGTRFSVDNSWEDIFKEAATAHDGENASLDPGEEWPSDDSEDADYDPDRKERSCSGTGIEENTPDDSSSSSGSFWFSDEASSQSRGSFEVKKSHRNLDKGDFLDSAIRVDSDNSDYQSFTGGQRRQRKDVDYKKLHDEMFGKDFFENEHSEDEDWGPGRRKRRKESGLGTFASSCDGEDEHVNLEVDRRAYKKLSSNAQDKRSIFRIPPNAVEKLRRVFAENELPPRDIKENLSKQLGLASEKVHKWFKNARYTALKIRKGEITKQLPSSITKGSNAEFGKNSLDQAEAKANFHWTSAIGACIPKKLRKARRRKNSKSLHVPLKMLHKRRLKVPSAENQPSSISLKHNMLKQLDLTYRQVQPRFKNTAHSENKRRSGLKKKHSLEKEVSGSVNEISNCADEINDKEHPYFVEMERLFALEDKLEKLKSKLRMLNKCEDKNNISSETSLDEELVIYVPVVEVREKV